MAAAIRRAVRDYAVHLDRERLSDCLWESVSTLRDDPFGRVDAMEVARLVDERWQEISNEADAYPSVLVGRSQRSDMPFDVRRVSKAATRWMDRIADGDVADSQSPARPTAAQLMAELGVSRATAYRVIRSWDCDPAHALKVTVAVLRRRSIARLEADGRTKMAARRLLLRHPGLIGNPSAAPARRRRQE